MTIPAIVPALLASLGVVYLVLAALKVAPFGLRERRIAKSRGDDAVFRFRVAMGCFALVLAAVAAWGATR